MFHPEKPEKKTFFQEFREFAIKGNVIDLTVGVIIGAAFTKIVNSIVEDLVLPPLGVVLGRVDFTNLYILLPGQEDKIASAGKPLNSLADFKAAGVAVFSYGNFINNVIQFLIVAFAVFFMVRAINRLRERFGEPSAPPLAKRPCPFCLSEVPEEATKCAFCTSELPPISVTA
jgi:large conductance mechanosensitive channel